MTDRDAEMNALVAMLEDAGLIEPYTNEDGKPSMRLMTRGARLGRSMAQSGASTTSVSCASWYRLGTLPPRSMVRGQPDALDRQRGGTTMRGHRLPFLLGGALALALLPAATVAVEPCTITGTAGDDRFDDGPYGPGVVICGGAGDDRVVELAGATFRGGDGHDRVWALTDGVFRGGRGRDRVQILFDGVFIGGRARDVVQVMYGGTFSGGGSGDVVIRMRGGSFKGGDDIDLVHFMRGGTFKGGDDSDTADLMSGGTFSGGGGLDYVSTMYGGTFEGGDDDDDVDRMYGGTFSGDAGRDRIILCVDSPPAVYDSVEEVTELPCTTG